MSIRIALAFCLSFALAARAEAAPPVRAKSEATSGSVLALKAMRRMKHDLANGKTMEELKLPEASGELDSMLASLKKARAEHAPPTRDYKSPYRPGDEKAPADLEARLDNPNHPTFQKELAFMDTMIERGEALKRAGVPYKAFVEYSLHGWSRAMSLTLDPREHKGSGSMMRREQSLDPNAKNDGFWPSWTEDRMHDGKHFWFPTSKTLSIEDFNRLAAHKVSFIGLTDKVTWGDEGWWSPSEFPVHDVIHGFAGAGVNRAVANRYQKAIIMVKDPEVRHLLALNFFGVTHEDSFFDYKRLDEATAKYSPDKFEQAGIWLREYREKEYAPHLARIKATYATALEGVKENPAAVALLERVWDTVGGHGLSPKSLYGFRKKLPNGSAYYRVGDMLPLGSYEIKMNCEYSPGCKELVLGALKSVYDSAQFGGVIPVEKPSVAER